MRKWLTSSIIVSELDRDNFKALPALFRAALWNASYFFREAFGRNFELEEVWARRVKIRTLWMEPDQKRALTAYLNDEPCLKAQERHDGIYVDWGCPCEDKMPLDLSPEEARLVLPAVEILRPLETEGPRARALKKLISIVQERASKPSDKDPEISEL
jgi:hypothetical protein